MEILEIIGYSGSVLVAISLTMSNLKLLRWINLLGAAVFSFYGLLVHAYPVFALNAFICAADIYYIAKLSNKMEHFSYVGIKSASDSYLKEFLNFYDKDIRKYFPDFNAAALSEDASIFFILRDMVPAGLFIYEKEPGGLIDVKLDYVIPQYRDLKNSAFIYSDRAKLLSQQGFRTFVTKSFAKEHSDYLLKIGYERKAGAGNVYEKPMAAEKKA